MSSFFLPFASTNHRQVGKVAFAFPSGTTAIPKNEGDSEMALVPLFYDTRAPNFEVQPLLTF